MKHIIALLLITPLFTGSVKAQTVQHELAIKAGGGLSSLQYNPSEGTQTPGTGYMVGLGYTYFFTSSWGIATGAELGYYAAKGQLASYTNTATATTNGGTDFDFISSYSNYDERAHSLMLNIPLMTQYQTRYNRNKAFYVSFGVKISIPLSASYHSTGELTTKGYFPSINVTYEDLPDYGFVSNMPVDHKGDLNLKAALMASCEVGVKWHVGTKNSLYSGLYVDYGLNDINPTREELVSYQPDTPATFGYASMSNALSKSLVPLAAGLTLRYSFGLGASVMPKATNK